MGGFLFLFPFLFHVEHHESTGGFNKQCWILGAAQWLIGFYSPLRRGFRRRFFRLICLTFFYDRAILQAEHGNDRRGQEN